MSKETLISWLKDQQPILETILRTAADEYYGNNSTKSTFAFDAKKTGEELWLLSRGEDLCYDRPSIGFNYSLWYHPKRINTFLRYFTDVIYASKGEQAIEIFDLGAGTGAVLWAVGLVISGLKRLGLPCPKLKVVNIDTSAFMIIYNYHYLWKNFVKQYPEAEEISSESDYRLNSWSNVDEKSLNNIWLCASYLFDHSENIAIISEEFKNLIEKYKPNKVLLLSALQKRPFVDAVAGAIQQLNYSSVNQILDSQVFSGSLNKLSEFRNQISQRHNLGLTGTAQWNIDSLYGRILSNNAPQLGLTLDSINLFVQPEKNRSKISLSKQQEEAATINGRPTLIIGPAGCGKSVVITQKVKNIIQAASSGNDYNPNLKILVTSFNKGLIKNLGDWIEQLLEPGKFTRTFDISIYNKRSSHSYFKFRNSNQVNIYVMHFDVLPTKLGGIGAFNVAQNSSDMEEFHYNKMEAAITSYITARQIIRADFERVLNPEFLLDEYQRIVFGYECSSERAYQNIERTGRGNTPQLRYNSSRRIIVWGVIRTYLQDLKNNHLESFIIRRHRFIKRLRARGFQNKFSHIVVDEFQDCTKADYEIFYELLENPNNLSLAGDIAQSINLGTALHIPRANDPRMGNFVKKKLEGSFRLPFRVSECIRPLSEIIQRKFGEREGIQSDIINPYKGAPPGSRPIFVYAVDTKAAAFKIKEIFFSYRDALNLDKVTIFERDLDLNFDLIQNGTPCEPEIILKTKGLEKSCVAWSTRIDVDSETEKEEFVYTILSRTVSLLIVVLFPDTQDDFKGIIKHGFAHDRTANGLVVSKSIRWDEETEQKYQELMQSIDTTTDDVDQDDTEENQGTDDNIDQLID